MTSTAVLPRAWIEGFLDAIEANLPRERWVPVVNAILRIPTSSELTKRSMIRLREQAFERWG